MRVARYFVVPSDVIEQFDEYNNQFSAFDFKGEDGNLLVVKVLKLKEPKEKVTVEVG